MESKEINILFLGGAKRVSLAERFKESGKKVGKIVNIFSYELNLDVPISAIGKVIIGLKWADGGVYEHLIKTIKENNINIVLPFVDQSTVILAELENHALNQNVFFNIGSDLEVCDIFFNKLAANQWYIENGFKVPENKNDSLPLIAKPIFGSASKGIEILKTQKEFEDFKQNVNLNNYLIQQFIDGQEFTVDCYVDKNFEIISVIPRKRLETIDGEVSKSITIFDEEIIETSKQILKSGKFKGPITIQFIKNETETFVMEINPRFGGGVITTIQAGGDIPSMLINDYLNIKNIPVKSWTQNLMMMRANREFFIQK